MLAVYTLARRELVRFFRERSRVIGALAPPIVFWLLLGSGLGSSFSSGGMNYLQYFFPGTVLLIVLFTAIFSTISLIEDRREGFLQAVLVAPISRSAFVAGKLLGASTLAFIQGLLFLVLAPAVGLQLDLLHLIYVLVILYLAAFGLTGLGFVLAWRLNSTQGFHAVMNLFLIPMWMLSGSLFPTAGASAWIKVVVAVNPLTYGVSAMQQCFSVDGMRSVEQAPSLLVCSAVLAGFALLTFTLSVLSARRGDTA
jgi:ABC-2 type transport system permease protein